MEILCTYYPGEDIQGLSTIAIEEALLIMWKGFLDIFLPEFAVFIVLSAHPT